MTFFIGFCEFGPRGQNKPFFLMGMQPEQPLPELRFIPFFCSFVCNYCSCWDTPIAEGDGSRPFSQIHPNLNSMMIRHMIDIFPGSTSWALLPFEAYRNGQMFLWRARWSKKRKKKIHQSLGIPSEGMLQSHLSPVNKHFSSGKALGGTGGIFIMKGVVRKNWRY